MRAARQIFKIGAVNVLILLILAVPIELIFGSWLSGDRGIDILHVQPNTIEVEPSPLYPPGRMVSYSRDKNGFRDGTGDASRIDVLAVGGSTTFERYVDGVDTWPARLQRLLGEQGCNLTIANAGVDGYSTVGNLASFEQWFNRVPGLKPRYILNYVGINDAPLEPSALSDTPQKDLTWWRGAQHYIAARSAFYRLYLTLRGWWRARQGHVVHGEVPVAAGGAWEPTRLPADFAATAARRTAAYRDRLQRFDQLTRQWGSIPIYITQLRVDGRERDGNWEQAVGSTGAADTAMVLAINRTTLAFCHDSGEACVDLAGGIHFEPSDHYDAVHTTVSGSARIADFLAGQLFPLLCQERAVR
jgi:lysophospholipase L1-like esterase